MPYRTDDLRIEAVSPLISPAILAYYLPTSEAAGKLVFEARADCERILNGEDDRMLAVVGPCSIHDPAGALEFAERLREPMQRLRDDLCVVMRVYFEKPRTTVGWKGLINDPRLDGSFDINHGLWTARQLLLDLARIGVPAGTEFLDTISPQYIADLIAWGAIGARTTESQVHRELASGLSMPVGFKNGTGGSIRIAVEAIRAARGSHHFLSVTKQGVSAIVTTKGNDACHMILRGGKQGPNHDKASVAAVVDELRGHGLSTRLMIDCSHGNSGKDYRAQPAVAEEVGRQVADGDGDIAAVMIESNLVEGRQDLGDGRNLVHGQSVTDACVGWDQTVEMLDGLAEAVRKRRG